MARIFKIVITFSVIFLLSTTAKVHAASYTWTGAGGDNNWSTCANWSGTCPTAADTVTFDGTSTKSSVIDEAFGGTVTSLIINSGYTGTITLSRSLTTTGAITQADGTFNSTDKTLSIGGNLSLTAGSFNAPSTTLYVIGNFSHTGGAFNANGGTVNFYGGRQTISGSTTFYNFTKDSTGPASFGASGYQNMRLTITEGTTQTITGALTLENVEIFSATPGSTWNINPQGARNIQKINVQDSNNINLTPITLSGPCVDMGNNNNWIFPSNYGPTIVKDLAHTDSHGNFDNFNLRIDGPITMGFTSYNSMFFANLFGSDGKRNDLVVVVPGASYSYTRASSVYIISDSILAQSKFQGIGKTLDLADPANYTLRIDGALNQGGSYYGVGVFGSILPVDIHKDGKDDLILGQQSASVDGDPTGAVFIIYNALLNELASNPDLPAAKNISLSNASSYNLRINGPSSPTITLNGSSTLIASRFGGPSIVMGNILGDGEDLIVSAEQSTPLLGRAGAGAIYVFSYSKISNVQGTGNVISVNDPSAYTLRIDGQYTKAALGGYQDSCIVSADLRKAGRDSLVFPVKYEYPSGGYVYDSNSNTYTSKAKALILEHGALYFVSDQILSQFSATGTGQRLDLAESNSYNLKLGASPLAENDYAEFFSMATFNSAADLYGTGYLDIITSGMFMNYNDRKSSGSVYVIPHSVYSQYLSSTGNVKSIYDSTNYSMRFDGAFVGDWFGNDVIDYKDFFHTGKNDLLLGSPHGKWGGGRGENPGTVYIVKNSIFSGIRGRGNTKDMLNSSSSSIVYVGPYDSHLVTNSAKYNTADFDGLLLNINYGSYNDRPYSGSVYVIKNFPHSLTATGQGRTIAGTVTTSDSVTTVAHVQYSIDSSNPSSTSWHNCAGTTSYRCALSSLSSGTHTVYIRAQDTNGVYTKQSQYKSLRVAIKESSNYVYENGIEDTPVSPTPSITAVPTIEMTDTISQPTLTRPSTYIDKGNTRISGKSIFLSSCCGTIIIIALIIAFLYAKKRKKEEETVKKKK